MIADSLTTVSDRPFPEVIKKPAISAGFGVFFFCNSAL
ncbi:hypothetical protein F396_gp26 [Pectobacterium phage ZF40]|nr:hypothetical protein F396_gp26 [Pectobacterium phage ZF40]AFC22478.1 hypothetical protein ZF40_0026 [Pectobacterium phage ZF40]